VFVFRGDGVATTLSESNRRSPHEQNRTEEKRRRESRARIQPVLFGIATHVAPAAGQSVTKRQLDEVLEKLDHLSAKLDKVTKRLGCPIDEYVAGTCTDNPAGTTVTYCITQGRSGEVAGKYAIEPKATAKVGARWDIAALGAIEGELSFPLLLPVVPIPVPTEIAIGGSATHGRGFDICVEIPLRAATKDAATLDRIVKDMNPSSDTKYQRRLTCLLNYASLRVPSASRVAATKSEAAVADDLDLDLLDDAMERFSAGQFQHSDGPLGPRDSRPAIVTRSAGTGSARAGRSGRAVPDVAVCRSGQPSADVRYAALVRKHREPLAGHCQSMQLARRRADV
jgi:hypothetical protein